KISNRHLTIFTYLRSKLDGKRHLFLNDYIGIGLKTQFYDSIRLSLHILEPELNDFSQITRAVIIRRLEATKNLNLVDRLKQQICWQKPIYYRYNALTHIVRS